MHSLKILTLIVIVQQILIVHLCMFSKGGGHMDVILIGVYHDCINFTFFFYKKKLISLVIIIKEKIKR